MFVWLLVYESGMKHTGMMTTEWIGLAFMHRYHMQIQKFLRNGGDYYDVCAQ